MFITKDKPSQQGEESESIQMLKRNQDELLFRIKNIEQYLIDKFGLTVKEILTSYLRVKKEAILSTYDHEVQEVPITLNPIIVTNERNS